MSKKIFWISFLKDFLFKKLKPHNTKLQKIYRFFWFVRGFTLVELIVVMSILLILWFLGFIQINWYIKNSRDIARLENLKVINTSIWIFALDKNYFPQPDEWIEITFSWTKLWTQWVFWNNLFRIVQKINKKPIDIITNTDFSYSLSNDWKEYELWAVLEWDSINQITFIPQIYALWTIPWRSLVLWKYNGQAIKTSTWWLIYIFAMPTIISRDLSQKDITDIIEQEKLAYKWYWNLPASYNWTIFKVDWWFNFTPNMLIVYSWSLENLQDNETERIKLLKNLQDSYSWTILENADWIDDLLEIIIDPDSPSKQVKELSYNFVENILNIDIPIILTSWSWFLTYDFTNVLINADTRSITQDTLWDVWFATKNWVHVFQSWDWISYDESDGLVDDDVRSVIEDQYWNLWFATNKWLSKFNWYNWLTYNKWDGLIDNDVVSIIEDSDWNLWFATKKWVSKFNWTTWTNYTESQARLTNKIVKSISQDLSWNLWFATIDWVSKFDWTNWTSYNEVDWLVDKNVNYVYTDSINNVWFWTINWLSKYDWSTWTNYNEFDWLVDKDVQVIYEDNESNMWFWTANWISKYDWVMWTTYNTDDGLADNDVQVIYQDDDSNMWFGTKKWVTIFY